MSWSSGAGAVPTSMGTTMRDLTSPTPAGGGEAVGSSLSAKGTSLAPTTTGGDSGYRSIVFLACCHGFALPRTKTAIHSEGCPGSLVIRAIGGTNA